MITYLYYTGTEVDSPQDRILKSFYVFSGIGLQQPSWLRHLTILLGTAEEIKPNADRQSTYKNTDFIGTFFSKEQVGISSLSNSRDCFKSAGKSIVEV